MSNVCFQHTTNETYINQWDYVLSHWKPAVVYLLGCTESEWSKHKPLRTAVAIQTAAEINDMNQLVVISPQQARYMPGLVSLHDFDHPKRATYLFGGDRDNLSEEDFGGREPDHVVYIPTDTHDEMYSFMAAAVTLYDRAIKHG